MSGRRAAPVALALGFALWAWPGSAVALPPPGQCEYDAGTNTATYLWRTTHTPGVDQIPIVTRVGGSQLNVGSSACGAATVDNTDTIVFAGTPPLGATDSFIVSLADGPIGPGEAVEGSGEPEIEIVAPEATGRVSVRIDTGGANDHVVAGTGGINLNAAETIDDVDVTVASSLRITAMGCLPATPYTAFSCAVNGGSTGNDTYSIAGDAVTGAALEVGNDFSPLLVGGPGADTLTAIPRARLHGGTGDDTLHTPAPVAGQFQRPILDYIGETSPVTVDLGLGTATGATIGTDTIDVLTDETLIGWEIRGTTGDDVLTGGPAGELFGPGEGNDDVIGAGGDDNLVETGAGNDEFDGGPGDDTAGGGAGNDRLFGDEDDDSLSAGDGIDELEGHGGDDDLFAGPGEDEMDGGPGADIVWWNGIGAGVTVDLVTDPETLGGAATGYFAENFEGVTGTSFGDVLRGDAGPNVINGWSTSGEPELIEGREGDDTLTVGFGSVGGTVEGGTGEDAIVGSIATDLLRGPADGERDTIDCIEGENDRGTGDEGLDEIINCDPVDEPPPTPPGPDPPLDQSTPPPAAPPEGPPAGPPLTPPVTPPVLGPPPALNQLVTLPSSRRCVSRRRFRVRVRSAIRGTIQRVTIFINGKRKARVAGTRLGLPIDLRGLPKGRVRVRLVVELADGRIRTDTRTYRTCATKKRRGQFGRRRG